jgi:nucleoside phosphorylase
MPKTYRRGDYTVGWVCPLEVEQIAALQMLDHEHPPLSQPETDHNVYNLGSIAGKNVVIAGLPQTGNCSAATVVNQLRNTFPNVRYGLLVGIGGGFPTTTEAGVIKLGDVVVSKPTSVHSGAIQYDHGKLLNDQFERCGALAPPPTILLNAARDMAAKRAVQENDPLEANIKRIDIKRSSLQRFKHPGISQDHLYQPDYLHRMPGASCDEGGCDPSQRIPRPADLDWGRVTVHRGTIASGELVIKNALSRDKLARDGVLCFEMEAAGALIDFPCMVIRGISDYCDTHKNDIWHGYASATAAAYARQLFFHLPVHETD